ncbi:MAG: 3-deoxy-7-phosphoheptulonate synthase, partial [Candidatus Sumerlaeota bacterium]|nr:3-deoxy-7-phosphoheptulonate synthase [Candidatus Sumerlaeota bacterium]
ERVARAAGPFGLVGRGAQPEGSTVRFGDFEFGAGRVGVIAGPCAVESRDQILRAAEAVKRAGAVGLRGGAFKPRTNPYSFRGLEEEGLELLVEAREATGLPICTEVMQVDDVELVAHCADMLQVGARNMQNFPLLEAVGRTRKPVLLKRGMSATPEELLQAAEYIAKEGNKAILLCERGVRTFETFTRNTLSLAVVPHLKSLTHLPVLVDPSHGTGRSDLVAPAMLGAVAMGADGLLVEVHPDPARALCDGDQSLDGDQFREAMSNAARVAVAVGRDL